MTDGFFLWSMANFSGAVFGICGKTISALRRNLVIHLSDWLGGVVKVTEHRSENKLVVTDSFGRKNTYYLFGGEDEGAYALVQGITLAGAFLDEVALMPRSFVEQVCARCSVEGSKLWFNCNPASPEHWFYKEWILKCEEKRALHLHFTMEDNPGLSPKIRARYERLYSGVFYRRYVLGQWCASDGLVYAFDPQLHTVKELPKVGRYFISVDYGTQNPFSAGLWCVHNGVAVRIKEFYYSGRATGRLMTDEEYYRALEELAGTYPVELVVVDPSASSFIATIRKAGRFSVRKAKNDVLPGILLVTACLRNGKLKIGENCRHAIGEFSQYVWEEGQERPKKENDHAMDDVRYFCATILKRCL